MKLIQKKASLVVCLFLFIPHVKSQTIPNEIDSSQYYSQWLNNCQLNKSAQDNLSSIFGLHLYYTLQFVLSEQPSMLEQIQALEKDIENKIDGWPEANPLKGYISVELKLRKILLSVKQNNQLDAAWLFKQAHKQALINTANFPDYLPNYKSLGTLQIIIGSIPDKYKWIAHLIGLTSSIDEGLQAFKKCFSANHSLAIEAKLQYALVQAYVLGNSNKAILALNNFSFSSSFALMTAMALHSKNHESAKTLTLFEQSQSVRCEPFIYYLAAEAYLQKGEYQLAWANYKVFLNNHKGTSNIKDAHYKIYLCAFLSGQTDGLEQLKNNAKQLGSLSSEADKNANKALSETVNPGILKLRLATDGGFYDLANQMLQTNFQLHSTKDSIEFLYRKGRLLEATGFTKEANELFKAVVEKGGPYNWYFIPNSALILGNSYLNNNELDSAAIYFNTVKKFKGHPYKNSLDAKAEAGLNIIKDRTSD